MCVRERKKEKNLKYFLFIFCDAIVIHCGGKVLVHMYCQIVSNLTLRRVLLGRSLVSINQRVVRSDELALI